MTQFGFTRSFRTEKIEERKTGHFPEDDITEKRSEIEADTDDGLVSEYGNHFGSVFMQ